MQRVILSSAAALSLLVSGCAADVAPSSDELRRPACGGIAGLPCPDGRVCVDDPRDDCDPDNGGADCGGICVPDRCDYDDPNRVYFARSPEECTWVRFQCQPGTERFADECGCGCEVADSECAEQALCRRGTTWNDDTCSCEPSLIISPAPEPFPVPVVQCGETVCTGGMFCCNASCGICAPPGGACTQQICPSIR